MKLAPLVALAAVLGLAQTPSDPLPEWVLQLSRVKQHLKENFERMPNYVCRETVDRFEKKAGSPRLVKVDSMQFEVAQVGHKELLSRPGRGGFEDKDLATYMSAGLLGTGEFSSIPRNLFLSDAARITPDPETPHGELSFRYEIPAFLGKFTLAVAGKEAAVGQQGVFRVDAESLDLIRIESHAVDIPVSLGMSGAGSTVEYAHMRIGSSVMLLPRSAEQVVEHPDGSERRNKIQFTGCREYGSESTIRFEGPTEPPPVVKKK